MLYIAVVGGSECTEDEKMLARETGKEIARRGGVVICGGGSGVMEAVSDGACGEGGNVLGILPGSDHLIGITSWVLQAPHRISGRAIIEAGSANEAVKIAFNAAGH